MIRVVRFRRNEAKRIHIYLETNLGYSRYSNDIYIGILRIKMNDNLRGHTFKTSAKFWHFLTPPPPFIRISRNLSVLFVRKIGQFLNPPSPPPCGRLKSIAPYLNLRFNDNISHSEKHTISSGFHLILPFNLHILGD